jgi:hypothetical protein
MTWLTSTVSGGKAGTLKVTDSTIEWKTALLNFGGKFAHPLSEIQSVGRGRYLNFWVFPSKCLLITFTNGKSYKFTFKFSGGAKRQVEQDLVTFLRSKGVKVDL